MENFSNMINWDNVFKQSENFQNNMPFRFGFIEEIFQHDFYKKLYDTFPSLDKFEDGSDWSKSQLLLRWGNTKPKQIVVEGDDPTMSYEWNKFKRFAKSEEFIENFRKFSGIPVNRLQQFHFLSYREGGFQLPHIHNVGPSTLVMMFYFSEGWEEGQSGGTYMATDVDESTIIFEPYNLDNSMALFHDGPKSAHGIRMITKDVERRALQITLEEWSKENGWSGGYI